MSDYNREEKGDAARFQTSRYAGLRLLRGDLAVGTAARSGDLRRARNLRRALSNRPLENEDDLSIHVAAHRVQVVLNVFALPQLAGPA
jgi:hypothetical protein